MQLIKKYNKGVRSLLCNIETCRKYLWVALLKDKNVLKSLIIFKNFLDESDRKPKKYGQISVVSFTKVHWTYGWMAMSLKYIQYIMPGNLLLLRDLSDT